MDKEVLIKELMWDYDYTKRKATELVEKYMAKGKYEELCNIVRFKQHKPEL